MSSDIAINVENLSKCYHIYDNPRDRLLQMFVRGRKQYFREFWALRDVSFEIKRGETVGIVGRNGSGKSTLLQMICGTLNQSSGTISTSGRIAALLELGAGFNPEFTGRENVYLNASVLGLSRTEIDNKFDGIASFADIGEFLEQPVKTFSSGMLVRLAFSVAIHVEPEILIVDEALSVGDAYFQAKCAKVIKKIIDNGTTLLFVSHDTASVKTLCSRALLLEAGERRYFGDANTAIEKYYSGLVERNDAVGNVGLRKEEAALVTSCYYFDNEKFLAVSDFQRIKNGNAYFVNVQVINKSGRAIDTVFFGEEITLRQVVKVEQSFSRLGLGYHIRDKNGFDLIYSDTGIESGRHIEQPKSGGVYVVDWTFKVNLREGSYVISSMLSVPVDLQIGDVEVIDFIPISVTLAVSRGKALPIYGAVYWDNKLDIKEVGNG